MRGAKFILIALLSAAAISGCGNGGDTSGGADGEKTLRVVTTTGQIADMVANIGGDLVTVQALMGPGIDPHLYKASARDVERLRRADIIIYNGLHLEAKMGEVLEQLRRTKAVMAVADALPEEKLIAPDAFAEAHDPHIWFDVALWRKGALEVAETLAGLDPDHAQAYRQGGRDYAARLTELDRYTREQLATIPASQRVMITAHDAFNYLGRAYGLQVRGLQGISTAAEAGTRDVQELAAFIAENKIPAIFVETSVSPRAVNAVREAVRARGFEVAIGGEIFSDALGDAGTPAGTYIGMVRHNVDTITSALRGKGSDHHE